MHLKERPEVPGRKGTGHCVLLEFGIHLLDWVRVMIPNEPLTITAPEKHANNTLSTSSGLSCHLDMARVKTTRVTPIDIGTNGHVRANWTTGLL